MMRILIIVEEKQNVYNILINIDKRDEDGENEEDDGQARQAQCSSQ